MTTLTTCFRRNKQAPRVLVQEVEQEAADGQAATSEKSVRDEEEDIIQVRLRKVIAEEEKRKALAAAANAADSDSYIDESGSSAGSDS